MAKDPKEAAVFSALADSELAKRTLDGNTQAVLDLQQAIRLDTKSPRDYMLLSELQYRANRVPDAIVALSTALDEVPLSADAVRKSRHLLSAFGRQAESSGHRAPRDSSSFRLTRT
jgi:cytochrome c-type biogenesis protein CcmH/NrfG